MDTFFEDLLTLSFLSIRISSDSASFIISLTNSSKILSCLFNLRHSIIIFCFHVGRFLNRYVSAYLYLLARFLRLFFIVLFYYRTRRKPICFNPGRRTYETCRVSYSHRPWRGARSGFGEADLYGCCCRHPSGSET